MLIDKINTISCQATVDWSFYTPNYPVKFIKLTGNLNTLVYATKDTAGNYYANYLDDLAGAKVSTNLFNIKSMYFM
jgi:hypothetical protein